MASLDVREVHLCVVGQPHCLLLDFGLEEYRSNCYAYGQCVVLALLFFISMSSLPGELSVRSCAQISDST
jgi:hypothetical protein